MLTRKLFTYALCASLFLGLPSSCIDWEDDPEDTEKGNSKEEGENHGSKNDETQKSDDPNQKEEDKSEENSSNLSLAKQCAQLINEIRKDPQAYGRKMGIDLEYVQPMPALKWNDMLASVAQSKAQDMADRNYFDHVDLEGYGINIRINEAGYELEPSWYSSKHLNYFESLHAGTNSTDPAYVVYDLILDKSISDVAEKGHRNHLLGITDWNSSLYDIGVGHGYSQRSTYKHYWSIIIAKHSW